MRTSPDTFASAEDRGERARLPDGQEVRALELPYALPVSEKKRQQCIEHIETRNEAKHIAEDFRLNNHYVFDGTNDIYVQTACAGLGCIARALGRDCALERRQINSNGQVVSRLKY